MANAHKGEDVLAATLGELGVRCVFGLPGTQNASLFDALRRARLRIVLPTSELAGSFMANGFARASGDVGVLATIAGPGFMWALPGLAEARLDSTPLLHIVGAPAERGGRFGHQVIAQAEVAAPLVKEVVEVRDVSRVRQAALYAYRLSTKGEPGPVLLQVADEALRRSHRPAPAAEGAPTVGEALALGGRGAEEEPDVSGLADAIRGARRPVLFVGMGAAGAADRVRELARHLSAPVVTTGSGRGIVPEDHPLSLRFDFVKGGLQAVNELFAEADLVLALGCRMSHNGTGGFRLKLPPDRLVHVNTDPEALDASYPARRAVEADVGELLEGVLPTLSASSAASTWTPEEVARWRERIEAERVSDPPEPDVPGVPTRTVRELVAILRDVVPRDGLVALDSGLHQVLVRRHFDVLTPGGLLMPSDFQSMGFGLPAAIGAKVAHPERTVVAVVGDGGFAMSGLELLTAAREKLALPVVVFNDGFLNLIRLQQLGDSGKTTAVRLRNPDMESFAEAVGARYVRADSDVRQRLGEAVRAPGPVLIDLPLGDSGAIRSRVRKGAAKAAARAALGPSLFERLKRLIRGS